MNILPNADKIIISIEKLIGYALNLDKQPDKALLFDIVLGYNISNAEELIANINSNIKNLKSVEKKADKYGKRYQVIMNLTGANNREANVLTGWVIEKEGGNPRLTTLYVTNRKAERVNQNENRTI